MCGAKKQESTNTHIKSSSNFSPQLVAFRSSAAVYLSPPPPPLLQVLKTFSAQSSPPRRTATPGPSRRQGGWSAWCFARSRNIRRRFYEAKSTLGESEKRLLSEHSNEVVVAFGY